MNIKQLGVLGSALIFLASSFSYEDINAAEGSVADLAVRVANLDKNIAEIKENIASKRGEASKDLVDLEIIKTNQLLAKQQQMAINKKLNGVESEVKMAKENVRKYVQARYMGKTYPKDMPLDSTKTLLKSAYLDTWDAKEKAELTKLLQKRDKAKSLLSVRETAKKQVTLISSVHQQEYNSTLNNVTDLINFTNTQKQRIEVLSRDRDVLAATLAAKKAIKRSKGDPKRLIKNFRKQKPEEKLTQTRALNKATRTMGEVGRETSKTIAATVVKAYDEGQLTTPVASAAPGGSSTASGSSSSLGSSPSFNGVGSLEIFLSRFTNPQVPLLLGPVAVERVVVRGMSQIGIPYAWGGGNYFGPTRGVRDGGVADTYGDFLKIGYDCSGLMMFVFASVGLLLPHYSGYQYAMGNHVPINQMRRGDMLFYGPGGSQHVALYLGNGTMLEAPQSGDIVKISPVRYGGITPDVVRFL